MTEDIKFSRETFAVGRNGHSRQLGISLMDVSSKAVVIEPTSSKGMVTNCSLRVPYEDIPALISSLQKFVK